MVADSMEEAAVESRFGKLPASDAELNGDFMQTLVRLATMTGDRRPPLQIPLNLSFGSA
jgi:hypothetical protein